MNIPIHHKKPAHANPCPASPPQKNARLTPWHRVRFTTLAALINESTLRPRLTWDESIHPIQLVQSNGRRWDFRLRANAAWIRPAQIQTPNGL